MSLPKVLLLTECTFSQNQRIDSRSVANVRLLDQIKSKNVPTLEIQSTLSSWPLATFLIKRFFFGYFFGLWWRCPPLSGDFTVFHNDPAAPHDHCGRCRIQTRDPCPRSLARYQWATTPKLNEYPLEVGCPQISLQSETEAKLKRNIAKLFFAK